MSTSLGSRPTIDYRSDGSDGYRAGACNIGPAEVRRRRLAAVAAVAGTIGIAAFLVATGVDPLVRLVMIAPLYGAFVTIYQALAKFCVGFAMTGLTNFGALGEQVRVDDEAARRADRAKALRAIAMCGAAAVVGGALFALLPL